MEPADFKVLIMKILLLMFVFLQFSLGSLSQVNRRYLNSKGKLVNDVQKAASYILIEKSDDTTYFVSKYRINNDILFKGVFRDSLMKTPNGKFSLYSYYYLPAQINSSVVGVGYYIALTGVFLDGQRSGPWVEYDRPGFKSHLYTFENDKLNGRFEEFDLNNGSVIEEGNLKDNKKEGEWNKYDRDALKPRYTEFYKGGKWVKTVYHTLPAKASAGLDKYIKKALDPYVDSLKNAGVMVNLSITETGKVNDLVGANQSVDANILAKIKNTFLQAPNFNPALVDDKPTRQIYYYNFKFIDDRLRIGLDRLYERTGGKEPPLDYPDYVGLRLKALGLGRPIK